MIISITGNCAMMELEVVMNMWLVMGLVMLWGLKSLVLTSASCVYSARFRRGQVQVSPFKYSQP